MRRIFAICVAIPVSVCWAQTPSVQISTDREALVPLTVCEVLENEHQYAGKMVAVMGRLSWSMLDGTWLSENGCSEKVPPSDPNWPYAVFLSCFDQAKPPAIVGQLKIDRAALEAKLSRLRKTTK